MTHELVRAQTYFTGEGFNPHSGFIPRPRVLAEHEGKLLNAALTFLKSGFSCKFGHITSKADAIEFGMWVYAAQTYIEFTLSCTTEFSVPEGGEQFDMPPHPEPRKLTQLEQQVYEAATDYLLRSFSTTIDASLNSQLLTEPIKTEATE